MWSAVVRSLETLATLPVYINSSKMEVALSGWLGSSQFTELIKQRFRRSQRRFPDASLSFTHVIGAEKLLFIFGLPH